MVPPPANASNSINLSVVSVSGQVPQAWLLSQGAARGTFPSRSGCQLPPLCTLCQSYKDLMHFVCAATYSGPSETETARSTRTDRL